MRGAPQLGFSATMRKIRARASLLTRFRPPTCLALETHVQYKRNPARCHLTTVLRVTKTRGSVHPDQNVLNATQNNLCRAVNRRRGRLACRASNYRRSARFSRTRSSRELKALTIQPRRWRSHTIMARILSEQSELSSSPSRSLCGCTTFWRDTTHIGDDPKISCECGNIYQLRRATSTALTDKVRDNRPRLSVRLLVKRTGRKKQCVCDKT